MISVCFNCGMDLWCENALNSGMNIRLKCISLNQ